MILKLTTHKFGLLKILFFKNGFELTTFFFSILSLYFDSTTFRKNIKLIELSCCNKLWFSNHYIYSTWFSTSLIDVWFKYETINSGRSSRVSISKVYKSDFNDLGIRIFMSFPLTKYYFEKLKVLDKHHHLKCRKRVM